MASWLTDGPTPYWPLLSSLIWTQLSPWSLGQRHFWKHGCQRRPPQLQTPQAHSVSTLWKTGRGPLRGASRGGAGPSGISPVLCSPGWCGCQSDARQTPKVRCGRAQHLLASSQSVQFMPFPLPPESSTLHIKKSHPGCNVNNAEGRSSCWDKAGMSWRGSCLIPLWQ